MEIPQIGHFNKTQRNEYLRNIFFLNPTLDWQSWGFATKSDKQIYNSNHDNTI